MLEELEDAYTSSLIPLTDAESRMFSRVLIVGTKYYDGLAEYDMFAEEDKFLFLLPDVKNRYDINAVMLHNGKTRIGHVSRGAGLSSMCEQFKSWGVHPKERTANTVLVCKLVARLGEDLIIAATHRVNERKARKYAQLKLKGA